MTFLYLTIITIALITVKPVVTCKKKGILVTALFHPLHTILYVTCNHFCLINKCHCSCDTSKC